MPSPCPPAVSPQTLQVGATRFQGHWAPRGRATEAYHQSQTGSDAHKGDVLVQGEYDTSDGAPPRQRFEVAAAAAIDDEGAIDESINGEHASQRLYSAVTLDILSNHGALYTCLYRLAVEGRTDEHDRQ